MPAPSELVTVYSGEFLNAGQVKGLLEEAGIRAFLQDEVMATLLPVVRMVKVQVARADVESASAIVDAFQESRSPVSASGSTIKSWGVTLGITLLLALSAIMYVAVIKTPRTSHGSARLLDEADQLYDRGEYAAATSTVQRALTIIEDTYGPTDRHVELCLELLISLADVEGRLEAEEPLITRLLAVQEHYRGPGDPQVAHTLYELANLDASLGRYADAEPLYKRIIEIRSNAYGNEHASVLRARGALAGLYNALGRYAEARDEEAEVLSVQGRRYGPDHLLVAESVHWLALINNRLGDYNAASALYGRLLSIYEKRFGFSHPAVAAVLIDYAMVLRRAGALDRADALELRAKAIRAAEAHPR